MMHVRKGDAERRLPLRPAPGRLWSLWDMLEFDAPSLIDLSKEIGRLGYYFQVEQSQEISAESREHNCTELKLYGEELSALGLRMCEAQMNRTIAMIADKNSTNSQISSCFVELGNRLRDECKLLHFISLNTEDAKYYEPSESLFGRLVDDKLPSILEDVSEAGKCLGLHRSTAAVFHLMRVMESGVQAFGTKLGISLVSDKVWQIILDQINAAIKALGRDPLAKQYASVSAHLYNVKLAWRNEVMHPKATYTHEEAEGIFRAVRSFMTDLVTLL